MGEYNIRAIEDNCGVKLPEPKSENAVAIIRTCRNLHQLYINKRKRNTIAQQWDKYWVDAYNVVLEELEKLGG